MLKFFVQPHPSQTTYNPISFSDPPKGHNKQKPNSKLLPYTLCSDEPIAMSFDDGSEPHSPASNLSYLAPHPKIEGLFIGMDNTLYTKNLVPGEAHTDEILLSMQDKDGREVEYREWNQSKSKLAAAILSGLDNLWIKSGSRVLYSGECGTTLSHISDLVGPEGMVYVADFAREKPLGQESDKTIMKMAATRLNIVPIVGPSRVACNYRMLINVVDVMLSIDSHVDHQTLETWAHVFAGHFLKNGGHYLICVKATKEVLFDGPEHIRYGLTPLQRLTLNEEHVFDVGVFRELHNSLSSSSCIPIMDHKELADDPSKARKCLKNGSVDTYLFHIRSTLVLPIYFVFETPCGLGLILAPHGLKEVADSDYKDVEKLANRFDEIFQVVCFEAFESSSEGLIQCKALFKQGVVTNKMIKLLDSHLPKPAYDASHKPCYVLAVSDAHLARSLFQITRGSTTNGEFYDEITRVFQMSIGNIIPGLGPKDLEKAQRKMALMYTKEMIKEAISGQKSKRKRKD